MQPRNLTMTVNNHAHQCDLAVLDERLASHQFGPQFEPAVEAVADLNNLGVSHMEAASYEEALECFKAALAQLEHGAISVRFATSPALANPARHSSNNPILDQSAHDSAESSAPEGSNVSKDSYIYQRREYDEGMHVFSTPVRMEGPVLAAMDSPNAGATVLLYNMGQLCLLRHRDEEANECLVRALFLARCNCRRENNSVTPVKPNLYPGVVAILHNIGYIQYRNCDLEKSLRTFNEALQVYRQVPNKLELAATLNCLGVLYFHSPKSDTSRAMDYYNKSLEIRRELIGTEHRDVATMLNNIGRVHYIKGEYDMALTKYLEALRIRRKLLGNDHLDVAATVYNAGQTYHQASKLTEALKYYQEFMSITVPKLGQTHRDVAIMLKCMAQIYHERREYERALSLYDEALSVGRAALGMHAEVASILNKMGNLYYERGDFDAAIIRYQEGLEVERQVLHSLHPNITVTLTNIGQIHKQRGEYVQALKL
jgi:tetratricopeptide (TPR) repeat protein